MRRRILPSLMVLLAVPLPAGADTVEVIVAPDEAYTFAPEVVTVAVADTVNWSKAATTARHNVRGTGRIFWSGPPTSEPFEFPVIFSAGRFQYVCVLHGAMDGEVEVPVTLKPAPVGLKFTVRWANAETETGSSFDVDYRIGSGAWKSWKDDVDGFTSVFGKKGKPVTVKDGKTYWFRARSQEDDAQSFWSPKASFAP